MVATIRLAAALTLAVLPSVVAAGQPPPGDRRPAQVPVAFADMKVAAWTRAVRTHAAGKIDEPVRTIAGWPGEHVTVVLGRIIRRMRVLVDIPDVRAERDLAELTGTMVRGLSLHTDIALAEREALMERPAAGARAAILLVDGRETRQVERSIHWAFARQIAAALALQASEAPRVLAWYRAIGAGLQEWGDYDLAVVHLEAGRMLFANDPMLALYQGTIHQTLGDARLRGYARQRHDILLSQRRAPLPGYVVGRPAASDLRRVPTASRRELDAAEREFRFVCRWIRSCTRRASDLPTC